MTPSHHPSAATLFDYGGGSLSEPLALAVVTHISMCTECRDRLAEIEAVGGVMLDDLPPEDMTPDCFARTLARLDDETPAPRREDDNAAVDGPFAGTPLTPYLGGVGELPWKRLGRGVAAVDLVRRRNRGTRATLFRVSRGTLLPLHGHRGREMTVVLEGKFFDETGAFVAGDFIEHDADVVHRPAVTNDEDCVCLIAVEGRLKFKGVLGRLLPLFVDM